MEIDLNQYGDEELRHLAALVADEQRRRLLEAGDTEAVVEQGFATGFDAKGHGRAPNLCNGFIVCHGSVVEKSATSHDCRFVHVGDGWVWEYADLVCDEVRRVGDRGRLHQRSVSLLVPVEGLELDFVTSVMRQGGHRMVSTSSYQIRSGELELVQTRAVKDFRHQR